MTTANQLVTWSTAENLIKAVGHDVQVTGAANLSVLPRCQPGNADSPLICHLLNGNYDPRTDSFSVKSNVELTIRETLLGRVYHAATLFALGQAPRAINCQASDGATTLIVPDLEMWGVLNLE